MRIVVICWKEDIPVIAIYEESKKTFATARTLQKDFFRETVQFLIKYKKSFERLYVVFSDGRFSHARQLTLLGNLFAMEYKYPISSSLAKKDVMTQEDLQSYITSQVPKAAWKKIITPAYAHEPHITKKRS